MDDLKQRAHRLTSLLLEQTWTGTAWVVVPEAELSALHGAFVTAWAAMLSAFSAGIAHADQFDPTVPDREKRLAALRKIVIVPPRGPVVANAQAIALVSGDALVPPGALRLTAP